MMMLKRISCSLMLLLFLTGCASFERDWRHATLQPSDRPNDVTGAWQGSWLSEVNGHTGSLRCLVTEKSPEEYEFRFKATYWKVFRYSYTVSMPVEFSSNAVSFTGQENLGYLAGGVYTYEGTISETNLNANYRCKFDHGTFKMTRP
jgi:hypothetical protein